MCGSLPAEAQQATVSEDLPKVPTWRLERDSNARPSGRKVSFLPMRNRVQRCPTMSLHISPPPQFLLNLIFSIHFLVLLFHILLLNIPLLNIPNITFLSILLIGILLHSILLS